MKQNEKVKTASYISGNDFLEALPLFDEDRINDFWSQIDRWSFGDTELTLVSIEKFVDEVLLYAEDYGLPNEDVSRIEKAATNLVKTLGAAYVDLES